MWEWLSENYANVIIGTAIAVLLFLAIRYWVKNRSCCGCRNRGTCGNCNKHSDENGGKAKNQ